MVDSNAFEALLETFVETNPRIERLEVIDGIYVLYVRVSAQAHSDSYEPFDLSINLSLDTQYEVVYLRASLSINVEAGSEEQYYQQLAFLQEKGLLDGNVVQIGDVQCSEQGKSWLYGLSSTHLFPFSDPHFCQSAVLLTLLQKNFELHLLGVGQHLLALLDGIENIAHDQPTHDARVN